MIKSIKRLIEHLTMKKIHYLLITVVVMMMISLTAGIVDAAPKADLWSFWKKHNKQNTAEIDHGLWDQLLKTYLISDDPSGVNLFRYRAVSANDKKTLEQYLGQLEAIDPRQYNLSEQKAYWINFYNAATVKLILDHPDVDTIRDIGEGFFASGPWDDPIAKVAGQTLTLNDMEHRILRPIYRDERIHYVVNCASFSCPNLAPMAFTAKNTESLLEQGAKDYINHPRGLRFVDGELVVSSIFIWYGSDFAKNKQDLLKYFAKYHQQPDRLLGYQGDLDDEYDWSLNAPKN